MEAINSRYAELSAAITEYELGVRQQGNARNEYELAGMWTANNDARSYMIVGDPAVRVATADVPVVERPIIESVAVVTGNSSQDTLPSVMEVGIPVATGKGSEEANSPTEFGLFDSTADAKQQIQDSLREFIQRMKKTLSDALSDASSLTVLTYVSDDINDVVYEDGQLKGEVELRAMTRIKADGDTTVCVPRSGSKIDMELWQIHKDMVGQALTHRADMIKVFGEAMVGLLDTLKVF
jgi:hypothetical protein